jgi:hypothetical protein
MAPSNSTRTHLFAAIAILAIFGLGCQYFQLPEHLQSEAATENPKSTVSDAPVFLNAEASGRISDIDRPRKPLSPDLGETSIDQRLAEVMKLREANGVLLENTNLVANNICLEADPALSMAAFAKLFVGLDKVAGTIYIPRIPGTNPRTGDDTKPNPLTLVVRTEHPAERLELPANWPIYDPEFRFSYDIELEIAKSAEQLKGIRMWEDSFEISADERFFINEKQGPDADYGPRYSRVKQRPVEEAQAKDELSRLPTTSDRKLLIVSEMASYGKLLAVLAVAEPRTRFRIVVRPTSYSQQ